MRAREAMAGLLLLALIGGAAGCKRRAPVVAAPVPAPAPAETPPAAETPPPPEPKPTEAAKEPAPELIVPAPPPKPVMPEPKPTPTAPAVPPPRIAPQLSPERQAELERKTNEALAAAEKNLERSYGKRLNATQHDLVQKIQGFLAQSREAIQAKDWTRASTLAEKARVLSIELVRSLSPTQ
ncbi:MAG: hypothetical protein K6U02_02420 [Firmicutes bacterium]|nr:hypothetical protein [Bacillota bacterium]